MSGITAETAFDQLKSIATIEDFKNLLDSLSIDAEGSKSVFYSARTGAGTDYLRIYQSLHVISRPIICKPVNTLLVTQTAA